VRGIVGTYHELNPFLEENPDGINLTAVTKEISERWKSLSQEDRVTITAGCVQEIEEERETKSLATHNVPLRAFYDARNTLQVVEKEVRSGSLSYLRSLISQRSTLTAISPIRKNRA
jgi:hypothetical protein